MWRWIKINEYNCIYANKFYTNFIALSDLSKDLVDFYHIQNYIAFLIQIIYYNPIFSQKPRFANKIRMFLCVFLA